MPFATLIQVPELEALQGEVVIFDCRFDLADPDAGRAAYRAGHIPGARYLHLDQDLSRSPTGFNGRHPLPDPDAFAATMRAGGVGAGTQVVAYDDAGGPYAARLWWLLRWLGHRDVAVLDGGLQSWTGALEQGDAGAIEPGDFAPSAPAAEATVSAQDLIDNIADGHGLLVVDARTAERFRGDPNPLDPVAGHIPGAANRFFKDNLGLDGRFKSPEALAVEWRAVLGDTPLRSAVMQCGSGVTACHNALALEVARMPGAMLYPGSWSEWIVDPSRPVARG